MKTHTYASWYMLVVICLRTYTFNHIYMYMLIQNGRHTWIEMCRFRDNDCLIIYTLHEGLCICLNYFNQRYKVSLTDQDRSLYIRRITMTGIYMFNLFNFFLQIKRKIKVLKNIFNHAIDVLKRNQQYIYM